MARALGTPTWIDFSTTDLEATKAFYTGLFGWTFEDSGEAMGHYQMVRAGSDLVAGGMDVSGMTGPDGSPLPSNWGIYLAVDDVDARTKLAVENGATVKVEPGDAGGAGRFAIVMDPTGADIGFWQAGDLEGYDFTMKPGSPVWFELMSQDYAKSVAFYTAVVGFDEVRMPGDDDFVYATDGAGDEASYGICDVTAVIPAEEGSFWRLYLNTESLDPALAKVAELGGTVLDGPVDSVFGRFATIADPTGARFQLIATSEATQDAGDER